MPPILARMSRKGVLNERIRPNTGKGWVAFRPLHPDGLYGENKKESNNGK
jgi:hypothetical protein